MTRVLAIDLNQHRPGFVAVEKNRSGPVRVLRAGQLELDRSTEDLDQSLSTSLGPVIKTCRPDRLLVGLNSGAVDTAKFTIPSGTDAETPLFVRNLAAVEFGAISDDAALDYLVAPADAAEPRPVTAFLLRDEPLERSRALLAEAGAAPDRVTVLAHGLAQLVEAPGDGLALVVSVSRDACTILAFSPFGPEASRSLRFPAAGAPAAVVEFCRRETLRTVLSLPDDATSEVTQVHVFGDSPVREELAAALSSEFGVTGRPRDPFENVRIDEEPQDAGAFAGLLGLAIAEAKREAPFIDLINPRRPRKPRNPVRTAAAVAAVLVAIIGGGTWYVWSQLDELDRENALLESRLRDLNQLVKDTQKKRQLAGALNTWEASRVSWLDELRDLTERMPPASDLRVRQLTVMPGRAGATVSFSGLALKPDAVPRMEQALRDDHHQLRTPALREQANGETKAWSFDTTMRVSRRSPEQYRAQFNMPPDYQLTRTEPGERP